MVHFNETSYTITVETGMNPVESWLSLKTELINILTMLRKEEMPQILETLSFLNDMELELEQAQKVYPRKIAKLTA